MRLKPNVMVLVLLLVGTVSAFGEDLEKALNDKYKDKVLVLRHPFESPSQEFDASGEVKGHKSEGAWTLYGRVLVEKFKIKDDRLELNGARLAYQFDPTKKQLVPHKSGGKLTVRIQLQKPLSSLEEATDVLAKVFALTPDDVVKSAPEYWQHYLETQLGLAKEKTPGTNPGESSTAILKKQAESKGEIVYSVDGNVVTAPKVKYQPEPDFSKEARKNNFQGTAGLNVVVDRTGAIQQVQIVRPLGMGLDEKAVQGARAWRFSPATKNGQPVAVTVYIEIEFRLYDDSH